MAVFDPEVEQGRVAELRPVHMGRTLERAGLDYEGHSGVAYSPTDLGMDWELLTTHREDHFTPKRRSTIRSPGPRFLRSQ